MSAHVSTSVHGSTLPQKKVNIKLKIKVKVSFILEQATKAQRRSRVIFGARWVGG
jgi:hypothetical protein